MAKSVKIFKEDYSGYEFNRPELDKETLAARQESLKTEINSYKETIEECETEIEIIGGWSQEEVEEWLYQQKLLADLFRKDMIKLSFEDKRQYIEQYDVKAEIKLINDEYHLKLSSRFGHKDVFLLSESYTHAWR